MIENIEKYKKATSSQIFQFCFPVIANGSLVGRLRPVTEESLHNEDEMQLLTEWRRAASEWFTTQFPVTLEGTRKWVQTDVLDASDRILFFVDDAKLNPIGQVGLCNYNQQKRECEFDNLIRGRKGDFSDIILYALISLGLWSIKFLDIQKGYLHVLADNVRATQIYKKLGFEEVKKVPLEKRVEGDVIRWIPIEGELDGEVERHLITMIIRREVFERLFQQK